MVVDVRACRMRMLVMVMLLLLLVMVVVLHGRGRSGRSGVHRGRRVRLAVSR